jgi:hypothetical protein
MNYKRKLLAVTFSALTAFVSTNTWASQADDLQVNNPYAREVPPGAPASASFMELHNPTDHDIVITNAQSAAADIVELHTHSNDNGVMRMRQIPQIVVPAHGQTMLQPGGLHIMLIEPQESLSAGQQIEVQLQFSDGSHKTVTMPVKSLTGMGKPMQHGHMH